MTLTVIVWQRSASFGSSLPTTNTDFIGGLPGLEPGETVMSAAPWWGIRAKSARFDQKVTFGAFVRGGVNWRIEKRRGPPNCS